MKTTPMLPLLACVACACGGLAWGGAARASCDISSVREALPVRTAAVAPLSSLLAGGPAQPGFVAGVFGPASDESMALDRVLLRQRLSSCVVDEFSGYAPRTEFDNTPWRFNAGGDGKKFEADEFDAWMKKRGVRIAKGRATPAETAETVAPAVAQ